MEWHTAKKGMTRPNNCLNADAALRALRTCVWREKGFGHMIGFDSTARREGEADVVHTTPDQGVPGTGWVPR